MEKIGKQSGRETLSYASSYSCGKGTLLRTLKRLQFTLTDGLAAKSAQAGGMLSVRINENANGTSLGSIIYGYIHARR